MLWIIQKGINALDSGVEHRFCAKEEAADASQLTDRLNDSVNGLRESKRNLRRFLNVFAFPSVDRSDRKFCLVQDILLFECQLLGWVRPEHTECPKWALIGEVGGHDCSVAEKLGDSQRDDEADSMFG